MYSAFVDPTNISPLGATLPAMFAKSSMVWGTMLYLYTNTRIRSKLNANLFSKEVQTNESSIRQSKISLF